MMTDYGSGTVSAHAISISGLVDLGEHFKDDPVAAAEDLGLGGWGQGIIPGGGIARKGLLGAAQDWAINAFQEAMKGTVIPGGALAYVSGAVYAQGLGTVTHAMNTYDKAVSDCQAQYGYPDVE